MHQAILDGYTSIVYNFVRDGNSQLTESDRCVFKPLDLEELWTEQNKASDGALSAVSLPKFTGLGRPTHKNLNEFIKQSTRLTVVMENTSFLHNFKNQ